MKNQQRIYRIKFSQVYPLLLQKIEKKGRMKEELDTVIKWLMGFDDEGLQEQLAKEVDYETLLSNAPKINDNAHLITGVICGVRVEELDDPVIQNARYLDKLVDELAKGRPLEKVLRT